MRKKLKARQAALWLFKCFLRGKVLRWACCWSVVLGTARSLTVPEEREMADEVRRLMARRLYKAR